ncbi:ERVV2 protein, partial [Heliornis fulica]|nr:ERVV2 protein [Heliornis fulica]
TAQLGGVCVLINVSCCTYIDQSGRVAMDVGDLWKQAKVLHEVTKDDTSSSLSELWEKFTSWLPNFACLKQLFVAVILIITLGLLICVMLQCYMWMCRQTGNTYEEWKKHKLRQNIESGKYFSKL